MTACFGLLASAALVGQATSAAFSARTQAAATFTAGAVVLAADAAGSVPFDPGPLKPGVTWVTCVNVTYTGTLAASVRFYLSSLSGTGGGYSYGVADYIGWRVEEGHGAIGGVTGDCTGFAADSALPSSGDLGDFFVASHDFASGVSSWAPSGTTPETRSYLLRYWVYDLDEVQGATATGVLTWESRSA